MSDISVTNLYPCRVETRNIPKSFKDKIYFIQDSEIRELPLYEFLEEFANQEVNTPQGIMSETQVFRIGKKFICGIFRNSVFKQLTGLCGIRKAVLAKYETLLNANNDVLFYYNRKLAEDELKEINQEHS